jgi:HK97 family phage prohead protease
MNERRAQMAAPELRADGAKRVITGYAAKFNVETVIGSSTWGFREVVRPGAFSRAVKDQDVRGLFNHDPNLLLGRNKAGTLRLVEDSVGLRYEIDPPDTMAGRDVVVSLERKDVTGSSFSFQTRKQAWTPGADGQLDLREVLDVDLYDVGPVTFPAYEEADATVRSLRSAADEALGRRARQEEELEGAAQRLHLRLRLAKAG